jgi:hypothetical protein
LLIGVVTVQSKFPAGPGAGSGYTLRVAQTDGAFGVFTVIEDNLSAAGGSTTAGFTGADSAAGTAGITGIGAFFAQAFTVSGSAGVAGVTVTYSGTASGSVVADGSGNFSIPNLFNGTYTLTPSLAGYSFSPTSRNVNVISANVTGQNFTATPLGLPILNTSVSVGVPTKLNGNTPISAPANLQFSVRGQGKDFSAAFQAVGTVTALTASLQISLDGVTWSDYTSSANFISNATTSKTITPLIAGVMYRVSATAVTGSQDIWVCAE